MEEPNPTDREHPRSLQKVDAEEAAIVRGIFRSYVKGDGLATIAAALNEKGVPAPRDATAYKKTAGKGWSTVQVRSMLRNERYIGRVTWNKREFFKDPLTKRRQARLRPAAEWVTSDVPDLRIITDDLWRAAQARHRTKQKGVPFQGPKKVHVFSGLLRCGVCGAGMSITGGRKVERNGKLFNWVAYGCSANHSKGEHSCANRAGISEEKVKVTVLEGLLAYVRGPEFKTWVEEATAASERARRRRPDDEATHLEAAVRAQAAKVERTAERYVESGSEAVKAILTREEETLRELRRQLAGASSLPAKRVTVNVAQVLEAFSDLDKLAQKEPAAARARLARFLDPVVLTPVEEDGVPFYDLDVFLKRETATLAGGRLGEGSCGGGIWSITDPIPFFPTIA